MKPNATKHRKIKLMTEKNLVCNKYHCLEIILAAVSFFKFSRYDANNYKNSVANIVDKR